jgi:hypothetical protein
MDILIYIVVAEYYVSNNIISVIRDNTGEILCESSQTKEVRIFVEKMENCEELSFSAKVCISLYYIMAA